MQLNKIYNMDCLDGMRLLEDESVDIIIADPPYFEVKGDFDFYFKSFDDYLKFVELWAFECSRVLKKTGTLLWWGHAKKIAYSQIILDKYLTLENNIVWSKKDCQTLRGIGGYRLFAPVTERVLMYSNEGKNKHDSLLAKIYDDKDLFLPVKNYLREQKRLSKLTNNQINAICGETNTASHCFTDSQWRFITEKAYAKLQNSTLFFKESYDELKESYDELRRPFNNDLKLTDVMVYGQETNISKKYKHPTQKSITLTKDLINSISRSDEIVLVPFVGSGT
jgi:site-specific DNA-methyltransferase (adenine-specific)